MNKQEALIRVNTLLAPYLYLDKTKTDGKDMRFKFSNMGLGVAPAEVHFLNTLSQESQAWPLTAEERNQIVDVLVLYSNHLDQHVDAAEHPKLEQALKEKTVLNWLQNAFSLFNDRTPALEVEEARTLSSFAQLLHYLGKALRYNGTPVEQRVVISQQSVALSQFLNALKLPEEQDPHQYITRNQTYELPVIYSLQELNRFDEALNIAIGHVNHAPTIFHAIQAEVQIAQIYRKKQEPEAGIVHAKKAHDLAVSDNSNLVFNAKQAWMECCSEAGIHEEAVQLAHEILQAQETNVTVKPFHLKAAHGVIEQANRATLSC
jgi:tetratricopeptide (TPR) repeat protein